MVLKKVYFYGIIEKSEVIEMIELSNAAEAKLYFENIIKELNGVKICAVFSASPWFNDNSGYRRYEDRSPVVAKAPQRRYEIPSEAILTDLAKEIESKSGKTLLFR